MDREIFVLQVGDKSDSVSVDRLKPVISAVPVTQVFLLFEVGLIWCQPRFPDFRILVILQ